MNKKLFDKEMYNKKKTKERQIQFVNRIAEKNFFFPFIKLILLQLQIKLLRVVVH